MLSLPKNQTLTDKTCRCFLFCARKTPGFGGVCWLYDENGCPEVNLFSIRYFYCTFSDLSMPIEAVNNLPIFLMTRKQVPIL